MPAKRSRDSRGNTTCTIKQHFIGNSKIWDLVVKRACCSYTRPGFGSWYLHDGLKPPVSSAPWVLEHAYGGHESGA